jgi:hypothetical protein
MCQSAPLALADYDRWTMETGMRELGEDFSRAAPKKSLDREQSLVKNLPCEDDEMGVLVPK